MMPLAAALPIAAILALMLGLRWPAARAGAAGLAVALLVAWRPFGFGEAVYPELGYTRATGGALLEAGFTTLTILWIIFPALCIYHLQVITGRVEHIRHAIAGMASDARLGLLLIVWFFALFIEGAAGFGAPVALAAPLLVSLGVRPLYAVTAALIGHSVGVSFGAIGTPIVPQAAATGLAPAELARATAAYHAPLGWVLALCAVWVAVGGLEEKHEGGRRGLALWTLLGAALFLAPMYAIARWIGPELPTLGGALAGGVLFALLLRLARGQVKPKAEAEAGAGKGMRLVAAAAPYLVLVALVLATRLIAPLRDLATSVALEWRLLEHFSGRMQPLYHPGTMLLAGFLLGALLQGAAAGQMRAAARRAASQLAPVSLALVAMLSISRVMVHSNMIATLAESGAGLGTAWPLLAPFVGVLGTFVTGSATASNILMSSLQQATAEGLALPVLPLLGAQTFGAAVGNIIAPHNIIAGCATVGLAGREGDVLRKTLWVCLLYAALGGALALVFVRM